MVSSCNTPPSGSCLLYSPSPILPPDRGHQQARSEGLPLWPCPSLLKVYGKVSLSATRAAAPPTVITCLPSGLDSLSSGKTQLHQLHQDLPKTTTPAAPPAPCAHDCAVQPIFYANNMGSIRLHCILERGRDGWEGGSRGAAARRGQAIGRVAQAPRGAARGVHCGRGGT